MGNFLGLNKVADFAGNLLGRVTGSTALNQQQQENYENQLQIRVRDGLKAGINPLAAIGASANYQPYFQSNNASLSEIGDLAGRAGKRLASLFEKKQEYDIEYDNEAKALDLESKRLENRILKQRLNAMFDTVSSDKPNSEIDDRPNRLGEESLFKVAYDLQGRPRLVVNQNVQEGDSDNAGYLASLKHAIVQGFVDKGSGRINSNQYKLMLDDMYYNMYGKHIVNLDKLYISPAEVAIATAELYGQVRGK